MTKFPRSSTTSQAQSYFQPSFLVEKVEVILDVSEAFNHLITSWFMHCHLFIAVLRAKDRFACFFPPSCWVNIWLSFCESVTLTHEMASSTLYTDAASGACWNSKDGRWCGGGSWKVTGPMGSESGRDPMWDDVWIYDKNEMIRDFQMSLSSTWTWAYIRLLCRMSMTGRDDRRRICGGVDIVWYGAVCACLRYLMDQHE